MPSLFFFYTYCGNASDYSAPNSFTFNDSFQKKIEEVTSLEEFDTEKLIRVANDVIQALATLPDDNSREATFYQNEKSLRPLIERLQFAMQKNIIDEAFPGAELKLENREPEVPAGSAKHDRFERPDLKNHCFRDSDCHIGGCSGEACSAQSGISSTCELIPDQPGGNCGCVNFSCQWYKSQENMKLKIEY